MKRRDTTINGRLHALLKQCECGAWFFPSSTRQKWCPRHQNINPHRLKKLRGELFGKGGHE